MTLLACKRLPALTGILLLGLLLTATTGCQLYRRVTGVTDSPAAADPAAPDGGATETAKPVAPPETATQPQSDPPVESVPEVDEVSIVDPAEPRLLSEDEEVPLASLERRVTRAETLSATLQERELPEEIAAQVDSGRAFLQDAKEARNTGDLKRADVLIDKCLVLLEDAEQQTRP